MSFCKSCFALISLFLTTAVFSQTVIWSDTFEDAGAPSSGARVPSVENHWPASPLYTRYFCRAAVTDLNLQNGSYTNIQGSKIWAAEDIDGALTGTNFGQSAAQTITWSGINISGKTALSFRGLFGCNNNNNDQIWEPGPAGASPTDYMVVSYRIDGGPWKDAVRLMGNNVGKMAPETTGDSTGDGTPLSSYVMTEFAKGIAGTGTTLDLQFKAFSNGSATEEFAIDNFRISFGDLSLPVTFGAVRATAAADRMDIDWSAVSEANTDHFEIQLSADGKDFVTVSSVQSKAAAGIAPASLDYHISIGLDKAAALLGLSCCTLLFFGMSFRKRKGGAIVFAILSGLVIYGCTKTGSGTIDHSSEKVYVRIAEVDKDGTKAYSKVVMVDRENGE
ncbi:hypothetical protein LQ567_20075 [Niabella pedocola]|uniref:Cleaved adhesin domain-containing protein n=1 Tax=Niabella pedocola TaxID=1752077 RepID=A0ABS8PVJ9_9BACT|nr:hypothetical protein [Niabella pedocola]MCD2425094.1 hypothetical protein [Niabella pedocola]